MKKIRSPNQMDAKVFEEAFKISQKFSVLDTLAFCSLLLIELDKRIAGSGSFIDKYASMQNAQGFVKIYINEQLLPKLSNKIKETPEQND